MKIKEILKTKRKKLQNSLDKNELALGEIIYNNANCQILSQSAKIYELVVEEERFNKTFECALLIDDEEEGNIIPKINNKKEGWNRYSYACLLQVENEMYLLDTEKKDEHKKYSREGMIKRVLQERRQKANTAKYSIKWADNMYGDHILTNENGVKYKIFLRDFINKIGYSDSMDSKVNKLGTTKHIMFAFDAYRANRFLQKKLSRTFPFIEIFCDPLNDYKITWYYPQDLPVDEQLIISRYFKKSSFIEDEDSVNLLGFIDEIQENTFFRVRPEVIEKIEAAFDKKLLEDLKKSYQPDYSKIKGNLFDYQKEGIDFVIFKKNAIIADEMGLGKTIQAIAAAIIKKEIFDFSKVLIVCPASIKEQWKNEIEKFSDEKAIVVQGKPEERAELYKNNEAYFFIINYETVWRDHPEINKNDFDFLILDEAQRAKNYETKTASSLKKIKAKHKLIITGTPIENRLIDIYSIMGILDPAFLGPLWEFSYQHCLFDPNKPNKINGYYDLQKLNKQLENILIRREKRKVLDQLPTLQQIDVPIGFSPLQADYHASFSRGIAKIISKKYLTPYDFQRIQILLANMRMVCDSTYLIDDETNESPKLEELEYMLLEKMDIKNNNTKIIIFSEWIKVHKLIGRMLRENNIGFVELNGKIPVKSRGELIRKFEDNPQYKIFLSTEAGGSGLNLQIADTIINFELPWNPAKKNQRIGRIDRIGQRNKNLTVYNFITQGSIEQRIATGLLVKQSLFDGVLGDNGKINEVDFSSKGRAQFIKELEEFIIEAEKQPKEQIEELEQIEDIVQEAEPITENEQKNYEIDFLSPDDKKQDDKIDVQSTETSETAENKESADKKTAEFETVMNNGMQFLAGIFKMTTGKDLGAEDQKITVNKETGEVTMKFKLPI